MFGDLPGWPKLPAGPPKFVKVLISLKDMLHESENAHHAGCSILRSAHRFSYRLRVSGVFLNDFIDSKGISCIFEYFRQFSKIFENFVIFVIMATNFEAGFLFEKR